MAREKINAQPLTHKKKIHIIAVTLLVNTVISLNNNETIYFLGIYISAGTCYMISTKVVSNT